MTTTTSTTPSTSSTDFDTTATEPSAPTVPLVPPAIAGAAVAGGALLVDVRSAGYREKHGELPQAVVVDKPTAAEVVPTLAATDAPVVVICGSEAGSTPVVEALAAIGYTALVHVAGGYPAWKAAGLPTTPGTEDSTDTRAEGAA
ncbi:Rhodanese-related sulfurtransferase [Quadrisphaera granulorum]|uniref:Rhodanese-related sulfurtransferase n=1 Tax=Quadrisphaera granulorum TaxID=317664 RepID=A0A315ZSP2_9ACTN|nr:rhodanese-like domain-containing protein [Quadrisphaera granulorum]PWJ48302.1 rhodanese-related sulfurtransferase [Quadrisphaera granulorum]SZE98463.1 Rhodanese-related sulfurtransferase [Quadrisphaera granulorum]